MPKPNPKQLFMDTGNGEGEITDEHERVFNTFSKRPRLPSSYRRMIYNYESGVSYLSGIFIPYEHHACDHVVSWRDLRNAAVFDEELLGATTKELRYARDYAGLERNNLRPLSKKENGAKSHNSYPEHQLELPDSHVLTIEAIELMRWEQSQRHSR